MFSATLPSNALGFRGVSLRRRATNVIAMMATALAAAAVLVPLFVVFGYLLLKGVGALNLSFFTKAPVAVGEVGGGMGNAIVGSAIVLALACLIGVPIGIGAGIFLSEFGQKKLGNTVRFTADVLNGVPSIVIGIAVYGLVVVKQGHFSAFAGGVALAIMMVSTVARTTEEMLLMVPHSIREAAMGLGIPYWRVTLSIVLRTATSGIITGVMLAFARVAGETAPLLFTALGNQFWNFKINQPTAALPLQIYVYALSPYDEWHRLAWAGALVLIGLIVGTVSLVRLLARRGTLRGAA